MEKFIAVILFASIATSMALPTYLEQELEFGDFELPRPSRLQKYRLPIYPQKALYSGYVHYDNNNKPLVLSYNQASANAMAHASSHTSQIFGGSQAAANAQASAYTGFGRW